jgi:uncharacterized protein
VTTDDGHYIVIAGRRWRVTDPAIPEDGAAVLRRALTAARRDVGAALGERGTPWWEQTLRERRQRWEAGPG